MDTHGRFIKNKCRQCKLVQWMPRFPDAVREASGQLQHYKLYTLFHFSFNSSPVRIYVRALYLSLRWDTVFAKCSAPPSARSVQLITHTHKQEILNTPNHRPRSSRKSMCMCGFVYLPSLSTEVSTT